MHEARPPTKGDRASFDLGPARRRRLV